MIVLAAAVAVGVVALAREGSSSSSATPPEELTASGCTTGPAEANVRVTVYGGGEAACTRINQEAAKASEQFWRTLPAGQEPQGELVCSMANGAAVIEVRDTGGHIYGNRICARLTAHGWHEQEGPGEKAERERKSQEADQKAAAERREASEREQTERREAAEDHKREAHEKVEREHEEAKQKQEQAAEEKRSAEELRRSNEEVQRSNREAESGR